MSIRKICNYKICEELKKLRCQLTKVWHRLADTTVDSSVFSLLELFMIMMNLMVDDEFLQNVK